MGHVVCKVVRMHETASGSKVALHTIIKGAGIDCSMVISIINMLHHLCAGVPMATSKDVYLIPNRTITLDTANTFNHSNCKLALEGFAMFKITAYTLICVFGFILNTLSLWVYFCHIPTTNPIILYLKNLVIADSLLVLTLLVKILRQSITSPNLNKIYCGFIAYVFYLNMYSSIFFMVYIAATRYLKIVRPLKSQAFQNLNTAKCLSLGTWSALMLLGILFVILINVPKQPQRSSPQTCLKIEKGWKNIYMFAHITGLTIFYLMLAAVCYCYFQVSRQLHLLSSLWSLKKKAKAKNNILILLAVFFICFVPYHIIKLPYMLSQTELIPDCYWQRVWYIAEESSLLLSTSNTCFDPVIYFLFCKVFRSKLGLGKKKVPGPN
ncbi:P2Y purinoceptor 14-like [Narcine bancroftii]|uniref:P2Y purinoceptor 14-like n=1 Tax=Narcine bancroftii TaxID=1343680 RepID=UPI003831DE52